MFGVALLLTVASVGVDYGWQPGEDGQLEYIIQIEPELVKTLSEGEVDLLSELPKELQHVKRFRIRVGTGPVPRTGLEEAQAAGIQPGDNLATQQPTLNGGQNTNDPRAVGTRRPANTRGSPTQSSGKVLQPPGRSDDPTQPLENDRVADASTGGNFAPVGRTPGISRPGSQSRDQFGKAADPNDPTDPLNNNRTPANIDAANAPRSGGPTPVWDNVTQQWRTPASGQTNAPDPRYANDPRTGLPEVRRDNTQDPRGYGSQYQQPPNGYPAGNYNAPRPNQNGQYQAPPAYNTTPLRDPDQGYYPPMYASRPEAQYDPNLPMNRQVGYQVAANTPSGGVPPAAAPAPANATPAAATPAAATSAATKSSTPVSSREMDRFGETNRPWWPLTFTAMLLFGSIGLNFYLGWIAHGIYQRYRALLMEVRNVRAAAI